MKFTVRRIANRNPHNSRILARPNKKLARVATSLFVLTLLVGGIFATDSQFLKSDLLDSDGSENFVCEATDFADSFKEKTERLSNLSRNFPDLFAGVELCSDLSDCSAVQKISEAEAKIRELENEIETLEKDFVTARDVFADRLIRVEDSVFFCPNAEICDPLEMELRTIQKCEKEFNRAAQLFKIKKEVEESYITLDEIGREQSAISLARDLNKEIYNSFERAEKSSQNYSDCVAAGDESVCQEYSERTVAAWESSAKAIFDLKNLQSEFEKIVEQVNSDIVAIELGKKDSENIEPNEGKGWCAEKLSESKKLLNSKILGATDSRLAYETALEKLAEKKELYKSEILAELEEAELHASAELAAAEEARLLEEKELAEQKAEAAAEAELNLKKSQAETLFEAWSMVRNLF